MSLSQNNKINLACLIYVVILIKAALSFMFDTGYQQWPIALVFVTLANILWIIGLFEESRKHKTQDE